MDALAFHPSSLWMFQCFLSRCNASFWIKIGLFYQVKKKKYMSILTLLRKFSRNVFWILPKAFSASTKMTLYLFSSDQSATVKTVIVFLMLHPRTNPTWSRDLLMDCWTLLIFYLGYLLDIPKWNWSTVFCFYAAFNMFWHHCYGCFITRIWTFSLFFFLNCTS